MAYEFNGRKYEKASAHQKEWGEKLIVELHLQGSERILDLGCGDGTLTAQLAQLVPDGAVVGIDASKGMIEAAIPRRKKNLEFVLMDINALKYVGEFDIVFSNAALHWVKDHRLLLQNVHHALREGGRLRFNFAGDGNCMNFFSVVRDAMSSAEFENLFEDFTWPWFMPSMTGYSAVVQDANFRNTHVWMENADRYFDDARAMIRWIDQPSLVPFLAHLPETSRAAFRETVLNKMLAMTQQADGRYFETFRRINVVAHK